MGYIATVRCDIRKGNFATKEKCHSDPQARIAAPECEAPASRDAVYAIERRAPALGWVKIRRRGWPVKWACPVCKDL